MSTRIRSPGARWFDSQRPHPFMACVRDAPLGDLCKACLWVLAEDAWTPAPVPHVIFCDRCKGQHIDTGEWVRRPHRVHLCEFCGECFPTDSGMPTYGVAIQPGMLPQMIAGMINDGFVTCTVGVSTGADGGGFVIHFHDGGGVP